MIERWGRVVEIWRYPVSSLRGERIDEVPLDGHGVTGDRTWGLIDDEGKIASPDTERRWRVVPQMLSRTGPSGPEISLDGSAWLPVPSSGADAAASYCTGFSVRFSPLAARISAATAGRMAPRYDRGHLHILTTASLRALAALLPAETRVDVRRFRPNIVIDLDQAEDGFPDRSLIGNRLRIGAALVAVDEPCERCSFTALAQGDLPFAKDVLHAVARHGGGGFGVLASVVEAAPIRTGDAVSLCG